MLSLERQEAYRARYARMRPGWQPATAVYQATVRRYLRPTTRLLDLGCGRGGLVEAIYQEVGWAAGADPDLASLVEHRTPTIARMAAFAEALPLADGSFDLVISSWTLEHLADPARAFAEVARLLGPGGHFIFLTPNAWHPVSLVNRLAPARLQGRVVRRAYGRAEADTFPARYRANTARCIHRLAQEAGLEEVALYRVGDPTYLAFSEPLFRSWAFVERLIPPSLRIHLVGDFRKL